jgi:type II secretory ATPase GspE/PulE/Tfp pilus assembly ATPase PilB-like protein
MVAREEFSRFGFDIPEAYANQSQLVVYKGEGCDRCKGTGYKGRTGVHELLPVTDEVRNLILKEEPAHVIRAAAAKAGMRSLQMDAAQKVLNGVTTLEEVVRVIYA